MKEDIDELKYEAVNNALHTANVIGLYAGGAK